MCKITSGPFPYENNTEKRQAPQVESQCEKMNTDVV